MSVIFLGFDPENLAVGAVGSVEDGGGIALGTILGSAMVAIALALGVAAVVAPMRFDQVPRRVLAVPVVAGLLLVAFALDGTLSRVDGAILTFGYGVASNAGRPRCEGLGEPQHARCRCPSARDSRSTRPPRAHMITG